MTIATVFFYIVVVAVLVVTPLFSASESKDDNNQQKNVRDTHTRHRASSMVKGLHKGQAGLDVECIMRAIAYDMAMRVPTAEKHSSSILESLQASACPNWTSMFPPPKERVDFTIKSDDTANFYKMLSVPTAHDICRLRKWERRRQQPWYLHRKSSSDT
ncbi:hypothetical protein IV203_000915 [Nitzschia inconspicua]|uniref:Uncharacterized protein n=1 Tax=Nitzschia inconspicua TaxID=303405 RepID=A0A9K3L6X1_9STRA|nr:hypothetical protein IV203_000915 [Nitzschia inconspicua]